METSFNIYKTSLESEFSSDPEQEDYFELNENFTHLTNLIRLQYFAYLKKIIQQNYTEWKENHPEINAQVISDEHLEKCAAHFEERAVRYCMVVQLYRKYMLRIITEIRRETTSHKLISKLRQFPLKFEGKREQDCTLNVKNEQVEKSNDFPKVGYKRKLENSRENSPETRPIAVIINGNLSGQFNDDTTEFESATDRQSTPNPVQKEEYTNTNGHIESNDSNPEETLCLQNSQPLVPYGSEDECSQQSAGCKPQTIPDTTNNSEPHPKPEELPYESLSLQEKIQKFEQTIMTCENKPMKILRQPNVRRKRSHLPQPMHFTHKKLSISQPISPVSTSSEEDSKPDYTEDTIAKDLESLFAEDGKTNDIEDIFGDGSYNPEIELILRAIENSKLPDETDAAGVGGARAKGKSSVDPAKKRKRYKLTPLTCDLRQSLWPCELHMWRQRLRDILGQLVEADIRQHEWVRGRFDELFGEDSEDEFAPYSPSLELDEVLISSCMKRIAPVIVKYLMHPLKDGLISNRYIFKKLAKKFAYNIVLIDQYADEDFIKEEIDSFFCAGRRVESLIDVDSV